MFLGTNLNGRHCATSNRTYEYQQTIPFLRIIAWCYGGKGGKISVLFLFLGHLPLGMNFGHLGRLWESRISARHCPLESGSLIQGRVTSRDFGMGGDTKKREMQIKGE